VYGYFVGDGMSFAWIVTTLVSFLAAGSGTVALLKYFKTRSKFRARFWLAEKTSYQISRVKQHVSVRPDHERVSRLNPQSPSELLFPIINIDITNRSGETKSLNTLEFVFSELKGSASEKAGPETVGIKFKEGVSAAGIEDFVRKHSLEPAGTKGAFSLYRLPAQSVTEEWIAAARREQDVVEFAVADKPGELHRKWVREERVDLKLNVAQRAYAYRVAHTLAKYERLPVKVSVSAEESASGQAAVNLIYDGGDVARLGTLDIEVVTLPFLHTVARATDGSEGDGPTVRSA